MLYFIISWLLLGFASYCVGTWLLFLCQAQTLGRSQERFFLSIWLGIGLIANGLLAMSLVLPLSPFVGGATLVGLSMPALLMPAPRQSIVRQVAQLPNYVATGGALLTALVAAFVSRQVTWFDAGFYQFGAIRWFADYGAVPGLALLNSRFGFVSAWLALAAPFHIDALGSKPSAILNGLALILWVLQGWMALQHLRRKEGTLADWFMVACLALILPVLLFTSFMSAILISPSPDIAVLAIATTLPWAILLIAPASQSPLTRLVPLLLAIVGVTFKLSALPMFVIAFAFYLSTFWRKSARGNKRLWLGLASPLLGLLPMFAVGIRISGCPLYPSTLMCLPRPWTLPAQQMANELAAINGWQAWFGEPPAGVNPLWWTLNEWLQLANLNKVMLLLAIVALPLMVWLVRRSVSQPDRGSLWVIALGFLGMVFILTQAPLIRFGLGYFVTIPALALAQLGMKRVQTKVSQLLQGLSEVAENLPPGTGLLILGFGSLLLVRFGSLALAQQLLLPPSLPEARVSPKQVNNVQYVLPNKSSQCWAAPLPCASEKLNDNVYLLDPSLGIEGGFEYR
jgi:hypothetical protein